MKTCKANVCLNPIMIIDDNEIDNFINERIIRTSGFTNIVYSHTSAKSALEFLKNIERVKDFPAELIPEYIFLDLIMPFMDGFHFLDEFEKYSSELKSKIKIIILTSSVNPCDLERSKKYERVINYYYKPLLEKDFQSVL
jgi:CheY-like chemotaxis protein